MAVAATSNPIYMFNRVHDMTGQNQNGISSIFSGRNSRQNLFFIESGPSCGDWLTGRWVRARETEAEPPLAAETAGEWELGRIAAAAG